MKKLQYIIFSLYFLAVSYCGFSQEKKLWSKIDKINVNKKLLQRTTRISKFKTFSLNLQDFRDKLKRISKEISEKTNIIEFPDADGNLMRFKIKESSLFDPDLARRYSSIKSYSGQNIDDKTSTIHFTLNSLGLYAIIFTSNKGTLYIDPYTKDRKDYMVYYKKNTSTNIDFECFTKSDFVPKSINQSYKNANDLKLRTFRLALATTEEYSNYIVDQAGVGAGSTRIDSITAVMSAITVSMTRVNAIYERDVALTMQLVANNDQLIFLQTDPGDDPYTNNDGSKMLSENQIVIDSIIGTSNYDIGHVFSTGGGGVAYLRSSCGTSKAGGVTGANAPVGDSFDIDFVAHEMGHQFGANHTFNGTTGNCGGNRNDDTSVEPGSGSTIMAYAGLCAPQNVQGSSDDYFHIVSIREMVDNITIGNSQCATLSNFSKNLHLPVADAGNDYVIPKSTPFILKGQGSDADGDVLSYCWEQIDNQVAGIDIPPSSTQIEGAVFRSFAPSDQPNRYMPALSTIILGKTASKWEVVPSVSRTMNFELTVRDNVVNEGQSSSDNMVVTVNDAAGPFTVTSQNTSGIIWNMGDTKMITWDVAGTDANSIDVNSVDILLSIDGGLTFPIILASNTPNDGSEDIIVPNILAPNVRVMVSAVGNIFYAINSESISIGSFETTCTMYESTDVPKQIPDNNSNGITSTISVPDNFAITDVNVNIDITHSWIRDLQIYLIAPNDSQLLIYDRSCGASNIARININAIFDDEAPSIVCEASVPAISGMTQPDNFLSFFDGLPSMGDWKLKVIDNAAVDIGTLNNWSLDLCQTNQTASVDDFLLNNFQVYPNPFDEKFTISFNPNTSDNVVVALYDISGMLLYTKKFTKLNFTFIEELNFSNLAAGVYILNVRNGNAKTSKKLVKY